MAPRPRRKGRRARLDELTVPLAAIISPNPASSAGGVERVCALLAGILQDGGWETRIVGPPRAATQWEYRLGLGFVAQSIVSVRQARQCRPDLIVGNGFLGAGGGGSIPRVQILHGTMVGCARALRGALPAREALRRGFGGGVAEALCARGAKRTVCVSEAVAEEARRWYRVRDAAVLANGVDVELFAPGDRAAARDSLGLAPDRRYALFVGRFEAGKGAEQALQGARGAGYELLVAGRGAPAEAHSLGVLGPERLAEAYAASDCVLLPSLYEACSLVVLEAIACGRPLLTTPVGWMKTLLHALPDYSRLCVRCDALDIEGRLRELPDLDADRLAASARSYVLEHNSLGAWSAGWRELLDDFAPPAGSSIVSAAGGAR
ncbi:MAG TPA: glycosyltransferase family 4 protein [Solirubrobacteraceae bacterium]|nr:glycosyltransferase family 4 protein [Solirubrobacteraceae bacterium]